MSSPEQLDETFAEEVDSNAEFLDTMSQVQDAMVEMRASIMEMAASNDSTRTSVAELTQRVIELGVAEQSGGASREVLELEDQLGEQQPELEAEVRPRVVPCNLALAPSAQVAFSTLSFRVTISERLRRIARSIELLQAATDGRARRIRQLVAQGADPNYTCSSLWHNRAVHLAAGCGHVRALRALIELGAALDAQDDDGGTPLHHAVYERHEECVRLLLLFGAPVNARDDCGFTPLHDAAAQATPAIVRALIAAGADRQSKNKEGKTPKDEAKNNALRALL